LLMHPDIERAAEIIRRGGLVAFPTETVYGLGANALDPAAVERIFEAKGRPASSPLIVHVATVEMARTLVREWPDAAEKLARRFWPGPLTLVLPKQPTVPSRVTAGLDTVGVRIPAHPVALDLLRTSGVPIAAPSANRFTEVSPTTAQHVRDSLGGAVDWIIDAGPAEVGIESAVLALTNADKPRLLRPGILSRGEIEAVIGPVLLSDSNQVHMSPGLHPRHYSPRTPVVLGNSPGPGIAHIWWRNEPESGRAIRMPADARAYAKRLYEVMHMLDREGWKLIAIEPVPEEEEWTGVRDRLERAAGGN
jgi:L-threonylcarbamoyladenylate synthase